MNYVPGKHTTLASRLVTFLTLYSFYIYLLVKPSTQPCWPTFAKWPMFAFSVHYKNFVDINCEVTLLTPFLDEMNYAPRNVVG